MRQKRENHPRADANPGGTPENPEKPEKTEKPEKEREEALITFYRRCHPQTRKAILEFVIRMAMEENSEKDCAFLKMCYN